MHALLAEDADASAGKMDLSSMVAMTFSSLPPAKTSTARSNPTLVLMPGCQLLQYLPCDADSMPYCTATLPVPLRWHVCPALHTCGQLVNDGCRSNCQAAGCEAMPQIVQPQQRAAKLHW
jgi:hypothetical protein